MVRKIGLLIVVSAIAVVAISCAAPISGTEASKPDTTSALAEVPKPGQPDPQPQGRLVFTGGYSGIVSAVGPDWIELAAGWREGQIVGEEKPYDNSKPKRFSVAGAPLTGIPPGTVANGGFCETHLIADLLIGDRVAAYTGVLASDGIDGKQWLIGIMIRRRPGGKIPPINGEMLFPGEQPTRHLREQAEQDWEEKGIPIPKKYLDPQGRASWTNPPYPPVAPMPREAKSASPTKP